MIFPVKQSSLSVIQLNTNNSYFNWDLYTHSLQVCRRIRQRLTPTMPFRQMRCPMPKATTRTNLNQNYSKHALLLRPKTLKRYVGGFAVFFCCALCMLYDSVGDCFIGCSFHSCVISGQFMDYYDRLIQNC